MKQHKKLMHSKSGRTTLFGMLIFLTLMIAGLHFAKIINVNDYIDKYKQQPTTNTPTIPTFQDNNTYETINGTQVLILPTTNATTCDLTNIIIDEDNLLSLKNFCIASSGNWQQTNNEISCSNGLSIETICNKEIGLQFKAACETQQANFDCNNNQLSCTC